MLPDGSILTKPGYDPASGLYLSTQPGVEWLPVKDKPTKADIAAAVQTLREPFAEFPYITEADLAVMISAILTGIQRRLLDCAPGHAFDASKQGCGKTLEADCASLIVTGRATPAFSVSGEEEEMRKKLTTALLAGDPIMLLDNIEAPIKSPALCTILTKSEFTDRLLTTMKKPVMATNVLFLVSGNNLVFAGEMSSRVIVSRINDPKVEEPEKRIFKIKDLRAYVLDNRPRLIHAALTILRGFYVAGKPNDLPQCRFPQWSDEIRAALVWAGFADPCMTQDRITRANPMLTAQRRIFNSWFDVIGADRMVLLRTLAEKASGFVVGESEKETEQRAQLKEALLEVASDGAKGDFEKIDVRKLGVWCGNNIDGVIDGLRLVRAGEKSDRALWMIEKITNPEDDPKPEKPKSKRVKPTEVQPKKRSFAK